MATKPKALLKHRKSKIVGIVGAKNGNNEPSSGIVITQPPPICKYDLVLNNYSSEEYEKIVGHLSSLGVSKKFIVAKEVGELENVPHLQCYVHWSKPMRITAIHKIPGFERVSMRECRNEQALIDYCKKDGDFIAYGFPKPIKIISTLRPYQQQIVDLYLTEPDDRKVYWFWEPTGNFGKSALVKYLCVTYGVLFCDGGKKADLINLVFNNDMDNCRCVVWDLPRGTKGNVSYATIEAVKNGLICNTKYETGYKYFNTPHIFIFANYEPDKPDELSHDRWVITKIDEPFNLV